MDLKNGIEIISCLALLHRTHAQRMESDVFEERLYARRFHED